MAAGIPSDSPQQTPAPSKKTVQRASGSAPTTSSKVRSPRPTHPPLCLDLIRPGMRVAVAVSGGADSVALLRALAQISTEKGLALSVVHMHHGIRGSAADEDAAFVEKLASHLGLHLAQKRVDTPAYGRAASRGLEEAARILRYSWFDELLASGSIDAIATAHTLHDQAETVLHKLIRGAWTEGLAGIHPVLKPATAKGLILRPLLGATRDQIVGWLTHIGQAWKEDASNADLGFTRNRIRHQLLPQLATFNPQIAHQLSQVATIARDEEAYWQKEIDRHLPALLLPGKAVRGGGRSTSTHPGERSLAIEVERLRTLHPALVRRLLRAAARQLGPALDFEQTNRLLALVEGLASATPRREDLTGELRAERSPRELRLLFSSMQSATPNPVEVTIPVPGEGEGFGYRIRCSLTSPTTEALPNALLRAALPSDRVQLRYSRGSSKRVKEVLERLGIPAAQRAEWPVLVWQGEIVWMRDAVLDLSASSHAILVEVHPLQST